MALSKAEMPTIDRTRSAATMASRAGADCPEEANDHSPHATGAKHPWQSSPSLRRMPARNSLIRRSESSRPQPLYVCIKPIHPIKIAAPEGEIAGARPAPSMGSQLAQRAERQRQQRRQSVDLAAAAQRDPLLQIQSIQPRSPPRERARSTHVTCRMRLPVTNHPGSANRRWTAMKFGRGMQSPSRIMQ